ncbi:MAG: tetratricopeptide repeat protein [Cyanobacteria bacterium J06621_15]
MNTTNNLDSKLKNLIKIAIQKHHSGHFETAISYYKEILEIRPDLAEVHASLAEALEKQGNLLAAIKSYQKALKVKPDYAEAHCNLGNLLKKQGDLEAAIESYQKALLIQPSFVEVYCNLGNLLKKQGDLEAAISAYQKALEIQPDLARAKFFICIHQLPIIYKNFTEIQLKRNNYQHHLQELAQHYKQANFQERKKASDAVGLSQPFYLAYQGLNDRDLQRIYGEMIVRIMSNRYPQWSQDTNLPDLQPNEKIRIGFVSGCFHRHSVWKIPTKGWVENLDKSQFELFAYHTNTTLKHDGETIKAGKIFDKFTKGPLAAEKWAEIIQQDNLHVLIFPEFGMDPTTLQLGCLRLAPVQMTSWGHPNTSGLPTIDYYLSSELMEAEDAQASYTEKLVKLPNLSIYYQPQPITPLKVTKKDIGIPEDSVMFWCCQSLYKYLPQHDDVFPKIARELDNCKFVFIQNEDETVNEVFQQRLRKAFEEVALNYENYCTFLPRMKARKFTGTAAIADVFLDSIGWSGCNSTLESIAHNVPVVTLPGEFMRGRHSMAILKMMNIEETIAFNKQEYVKIAVHLGRDAQYRKYLSELVAKNKHKLYNDLKPVRALEEFLFNVVGRPKISGADDIADNLRLAIQEHRANRVESAEQAYRKVLAIQPKHPEALYGLGILAQQRGELQQAEEFLGLAVKEQSNSAKNWFALGNLYQLQNKLPIAENAYKESIALRSDAAPIYNNLAYTLEQQGKWKEAIKYYKKALMLQPNCIEAEVNLGNILHTQARLSLEKRIYYAKLNYKLALNRKRLKDFQNAEIYLKKALKLQPNYEEALRCLIEISEGQSAKV